MQKQDMAREQEIETPLSDTDEIEDSCTCLRTRISELGCETFWLQKIDYMRSSTVKQLLHCAVEFRGPNAHICLWHGSTELCPRIGFLGVTILQHVCNDAGVDVTQQGVCWHEARH